MSALPAGVLREALIDVGAITHNVERLRELVGVPVIAVVKADGYGHGAVRSARAAVAGGASMLGVTDTSEALELRAAGITAPVLSWLHGPGTDFAPALAAGVTIAVSSLEQLRAVADAAGDTPAVVHLKLETGLSRNGVAPQEWDSLFAEAVRLESAGRIDVEGLFSHLSNTDPDADFTQLAALLRGVEAARAAGLRPRIRHLAATEAAIAHPELRLDAVRAGIGIYGLSPFPDRTSADLGLRPAMTLRGVVAAVRRVPAGAGISYGHTARAPRETTLALIPLGYRDGIPRSVSDTAPVRIGDGTYRIAGRVAMDQFIVDVGDADVAVGDEAVLFGDPSTGAPSAEDWAEAAGTINYEVVTCVGPRVGRTEVGA